MQEVSIQTEFITLGQFLKYVDLVGSGGEVRRYLANHIVRVNDVQETQRGRKLYPGDRVEVEGSGSFLLVKV